MKKQSIVLFVVTLTLSAWGMGCATTTYSLKPTTKASDDYFKKGLQYHVETQKQVKVSLAFDTMKTQSDALFDVKVTNLGDEKFDFDSSAFSCQLTSSSNPSQPVWGQIVDPETKILALQQRYEQLQPNGWNSLMRTLNALDEMGSLGPSRADHHRLHRAEERQAQLDLDELNRRSELREVISETRFWRGVSLRKTTLKKGKSVHGSVVCNFKKDDSLNQLLLSLKTQSKTFNYRFDRFKVGAPVAPTNPVTAVFAENGGEFPEINTIEECGAFSALARDRCREEVYARTQKKK